MTYKVHYFGAPGRAEVARLCLTLGGVPYEDVHYTKDTWPAFKPKTPFGQMPVLELPDGTMLAQSGAIDRYCAKLGGLYPEDPKEAALADQAAFLLGDMMEAVFPTFAITDADARAKARKELLDTGKLGTYLGYLEKLVAAAHDGYIAGSKLSFADVAIFTLMSSFFSGSMEGIAKEDLGRFPALKAFRNRIANLPKVKEHYAKAEGAFAVNKPDAE